MAEFVKQEGTFKARVASIKIEQVGADQSTKVAIIADVTQQLNPADGAWVDVPAGYQFPMDIWIIKKDGSPNDTAIKQLIAGLKFNGDYENIQNWVGTEIQAKVKRDEYKGVVSYKGEFGGGTEVPASTIADRLGSLTKGYATELGQVAPAPAPSAPAAPAAFEPVGSGAPAEVRDDMPF